MGPSPSGAVRYFASFDATGGAHVVDVWESAAALGVFVEQHLAPAMHNLNAYGAIEPFIVRSAST